MKLTPFSLNPKLTCLLLSSVALGTICQAQIPTTTGLTLWLEADAGSVTTSGGDVTQWTDKATALGGTLVLTPPGTGPAYNATGGGVLEDRPYLNFNPVSGSETLTQGGVLGGDVFSATAATIFIALRPTQFDETTASGIGGWSSGSTHGLVLQNPVGGQPLRYTHGPGSSAVSATQPALWLNNWHVLVARRDGASGLIRVDGNDLPLSGSFGTGIVPSESGTVAVGSFSGLFFQGDIAEIAIFNTALTGTDFTNVEDYFQNKYTVVPEPSAYASFFGIACLIGAVARRLRRRQA